MRPISLAVRSVATLALALGAAACDDVPTQSGATEVRGPRMSVSDARAPQLLVCPTQDATNSRAVIGPTGGSLSVRGSSITIPAGAVPEPTLFEVEVPVSKYMEVEIHAVGQPAYVFQKPATITINFARCPGDAIPMGATLAGAYIDGATGRVLEVMGGVVDKTGHKLIFITGHLSGYAIAY